jgi:glycyl-tRNA synthetase beta subunit
MLIIAVLVVHNAQVRGPPAKAAYDAAGNPTKALEGFCK